MSIENINYTTKEVTVLCDDRNYFSFIAESNIYDRYKLGKEAREKIYGSDNDN